MHPPQKEQAVAVLCMLGTMLCFSSVPVFLRYFASEGMDLWTVNAVRYSVAAVFWLPFVVMIGRRLRAERAGAGGQGSGAAAHRSIWLAAIVPTVVNTLGQVGWAAAPYYASASTVGFVIRTSFVFTIVFGFILIPAERALGRRAGFYVGVLISMGGVALMAFGSPAEAGGQKQTTLTGVAILLGTAVCWGAYAVSVRKYLAGYPLRLAFGVISLYTSAVLVVLMLLFGEYERLAELPGRLWAMLVFSGFIGVALGHVLYYRGIHGIGPVVASSVTLGAPFVTAVLATAFLDEKLAALQLVGGVTVVVGGALLVWVKGVFSRAQPELPRAGR